MLAHEVSAALFKGAALKIAKHPYVDISDDWIARQVRIVAPAECITAVGSVAKIQRVIFNPPATIVFWDDGTKTAVVCKECMYSDPYYKPYSPAGDWCKYAVARGVCGDGNTGRLIGTEEWKRSGIMAAMLKKAYGSKAPSMIEAAVNIGEFQDCGKL